MVLSLPVPSFSKSPTSTSTSSPLRPNDTNQSTTISEALRNNPFGTTSRSRLIPTPTTPTAEQAREQEELNNALETLARIFPDVKIEVFRELLVRFDGESRLRVCVEQLLRHKEEWVAGRWNVPGDNAEAAPVTGAGVVPRNERFRTTEYKIAVRTVLLKEFSGLSKSTVDAVLAEVNFCYVRARPTLRDLSKRTWRATFNSLFPSFKSKRDKEESPLIVWQRQTNGEAVPALKETGCAELDRELHDALLAPLLSAKKEECEDRDRRLAEELNQDEAKAAAALYECECCLSDVTFEQISTCSENMHIICYDCIRRTIQEALFGQGWGKSVDVERSTLKCLTPFAHDGCNGSLHPEVVKRAILLDKGGIETYLKFEGRLASDALLKSQLKLIRCPFCSYAEVDSVYHPSAKGITWRFRRDGIISTIILTILLLDTIPLLFIPVIILYILDPSTVQNFLRNSFLNLCLKVRPKRFTCANPLCQRVSCITCQKPWRDPHVCFEPLLLDLRATVEAARTAAVKRTCPRCGLSFVKSSGCNKLTCVCGYSMCYLCRKGLSPPSKAPQWFRPRQRQQENINPANEAEHDDQNIDDEEFEEPEGYKHFCEHFRINPGARCTECNKCELYQDEDEEAVARRAGEKAERDWRMRQGMASVGVRSFQVNRSFSRQNKSGGGLSLPGQGKNLTYWVDEVWREGRWKMEGQAFVDWVVERVVVIDEI
ncbi:RING finger protein (Zin) [Aspergillus nomiae NRRL 13137]|uniref:RING finger protein (Zin) n=1 Tax=Aspergillus nomiae NRRL (strain ATCC 15546 / NRRL 13137 / CBS 260.88 / M93) TaxID=1509407 RepID=A0A0L1JG47_ASPN3|nr:RING finger protein (Zin) [Aspergillus nomiae NRRL 13137]KNG90731.1 RING finger protein (Zin) [Aspergillus nomiae NRRL 13137]